MKKFMFTAAVLCVATAISASAQTTQNQKAVFNSMESYATQAFNAAREARYENTIEVTGRAQKEIVPDEIYIKITIDETTLKQKQTVEQLETQMITRLKGLGVDTDKDLKIGNMSSEYKDYFLKKNTARTSATYELKVDGVQLLGRVYQGLESLGISNMNITKLSHSKLKEFQDEMRADAVKNAQAVAQTLAAAVGQKIGRAVQIIDYNNDLSVPGPSVRADMMYMSKAAGANEYYDTELGFKEIKLNYSVQMKFALQ